MTAVAGLMRFSVVTQGNRGNFRATRKRELAEVAALILSPERLEARFAVFEAIPLRAFDAQTDQDFTLNIMFSALMPEAYQRRLTALAEPRPYIKLVAVTPDRRVDEVARSCVPEVGGRCASFRIDDDDALNPGYVADLRAAATDDNVGKVVTLQNGVYLQPEGGDLLVQDVVYPANAYGLAFVSEDGTTIFDQGAHQKVRERPIAILRRPRAWIRTLHGGSDSGVRIDENKPFKRLPCEVVAAELADYAAIDFCDVHRLLSV